MSAMMVRQDVLAEEHRGLCFRCSTQGRPLKRLPFVASVTLLGGDKSGVGKYGQVSFGWQAQMPVDNPGNVGSCESLQVSSA